MKDPLYRKILEGLEGPLNRDLFEECVCALLQDAHPGLVPIAGGNDGGMDGAISDGTGDAYPLVCTTAKDYTRNLRKNLRSYLKRGGRARKVVVATSQPLDATRMGRLRAQAEKIHGPEGVGFYLVQVHSQEDLAKRLYRNPQWRRELLGLGGDPPALSSFPPSRRPHVGLELIGRQEELEWLESTPGDKLVSGEPGMGKSFLLEKWAAEAGALFVLSEDLGRVADDLRERCPTALIVDDPQGSLDLLPRLRHLREDSGFRFDLVAATWKGSEVQVREAMGALPEASVLRLEPLRGWEIVEIFGAMGVRAPGPVLGELREQAAHKPGLAVTLAGIWMRGGWREVLSGRAISEDLIIAFRNLVGEESEAVLACFALGGNLGLSIKEVADFLDEPIRKIRHLATDLQAGGVLGEVLGLGDSEARRLCVKSVILRCALLRGVFFSASARDLDPAPLLECLEKDSQRLSSAVETLVRTRHVGARLPEELLRSLLLRAGSPWAWRAFADQGEAEALWALEHYPQGVLTIAAKALLNAPRQTLGRLLELARSEGREELQAAGPWSHGAPLEILRRWVHEKRVISEDPLDEWVRRRRILAEEARRWLAQGGDPQIAARAVVLALSPRLDGSEPHPDGVGLQIYWDVIPSEAIAGIEAIWRDSRAVFREISSELWQELSSLVREWALPRPPITEDPGRSTSMKAFAGELIRDLAQLSEGHPGLAAALAEIAETARIEPPELSRNGLFEWLYPTSAAWRREGVALPGFVEQTEHRWLKEGPEAVAAKIRGLEEEAKLFHRSSPPRRLRDLASRLAAQASSPCRWLEELLGAAAPADFVGPFLERILGAPTKEGIQLYRKALAEPGIGWEARNLLLSSVDPPPRLLAEALDGIEGYLPLVEKLCQSGGVGLPILEKLLEHEGAAVALAAAVGEWTAEPLGEVRAELRGAWRRALLRREDGRKESQAGMTNRYWIGQILAKDPDLAADWLAARIRDTAPQEVFPWDTFEAAAVGLSSERRIELLRSLPALAGWEPLVRALVRRDAVAFRVLLHRKELGFAQLVPLGGPPDEIWSPLALVALEAGCSVREIVWASLNENSGARYVHPNHWRPWREGFEALAKGADERLRGVAEDGLRLVEEFEDGDRKDLRDLEMRGSYATA